MGKAMLIFVAAVAIAGAYFSLGDQRAQFETEASLAADAVEILARNAALAGLDHAEQMLAENFRNYNNINGTSDGGVYEFRATRKGKKRVVVRATGASQTHSGETVTFNIRAEYERKPWPRIASAPPLFMQYTLSADGDVHMNGTVRGEPYAPESGSSVPPNANFHTNGFLEVKGNSSNVEGFGTYVLGALKNKAWVSKAFEPNDNPTESDHAYETDPLPIPPLDPGVMADALVADSVTNGSVTITGPSDLPAMDGYREDPFVWHIQGNLTFSGDVEIPGYAVFLVDQSLTFDRDVTTPEMDYNGADESTVAFYAGNTTQIHGNREIWGQIFTSNLDVDGNGSPEIYGNVVTHGSVSFGGTVDFYYRQASPALTTYFQGGFNDRLERLSYSEW